MDKETRRMLYWITILYFFLALINITLAMGALLCMAFPFFFAVKTGKKTWCQGYCPRGEFLNTLNKVSRRRKRPGWLTGEKIKSGLLGYFCINLMLIAASTFMVSSGKMLPIDRIRLFILLELPWESFWGFYTSPEPGVPSVRSIP